VHIPIVPTAERAGDIPESRAFPWRVSHPEMLTTAAAGDHPVACRSPVKSLGHRLRSFTGSSRHSQTRRSGVTLQTRLITTRQDGPKLTNRPLRAARGGIAGALGQFVVTGCAGWVFRPLGVALLGCLRPGCGILTADGLVRLGLAAALG
jgi:hypothetical protein